MFRICGTDLTVTVGSVSKRETYSLHDVHTSFWGDLDGRRERAPNSAGCTVEMLLVAVASKRYIVDPHLEICSRLCPSASRERDTISVTSKNASCHM